MYFAPSALGLTLLSSPVSPLNDTILSQVKYNMLQSATHSWELGTAAEALLEFSWPSVSVFSESAFPPPNTLNATFNLSDVLDIATKTIANKPADTLALVNDGAAGDPPSLGPIVLLANWTKTDLNNDTYAKAAQDQLDYILHYVSRAPNGAISHRQDQTQLWADFVSMTPTFIAYYGALFADPWLLQESYDQVRWYREYLRDQTTGLWNHIMLGDWQDYSKWATGNGWAAAGALRVHQTLNHSTLAGDFQNQQNDLLSWTGEILDKVWKHQTSSGALRNVLDDSSSFEDSSSTALMAAVTYRHAVVTGSDQYVGYANKAFEHVKSSIDSSGWLLYAVDPLTFTSSLADGAHTPEGQAFVLMMHAAQRDYLNAQVSLN